VPRFGLFLPQIRMPFDRLVERTLAAEAASFDSVWFIDHLWASGAEEMELLDGWTVASAVAARTATIRIGHLVLCDTFRHPAVLAKMAATLDVVSGGRFELGLGWGSTMDEFDAFGIEPRDAASRAARLGETLEVLRRLFTGERVSFTGEFFRLDGAVARPVPLQDPLPVHLGGAGQQRTLPLVREYATGWNCPSYAVDRLAELRPLAGDVEVSVQHPVALVASESERVEVQAVAARRFAGWGGLLVGTPDEVAAALGAEARLGVDRFIVQLWDFGRPESIDWFARDVVPAVG
jgi:alkanesulfonate monooxygenase SsuD/methylene tetrahydromethanopterin reductase-like flavin-dependent oxidoreductase (luciferase family)